MPWIIPAVGATVGLISSGVQGEYAKNAANQQLAAAEEAKKNQQGILAGQQAGVGTAFQGSQNAYQQAGQQGVGAIQGGLAGANQSLGTGLGYAQGQLGQVGQLGAQFTPGATQAVQTQGARSRMGEMYDNGFNFEADPGYQFRLQQGEQAIGRAASAAGGRMGGATLKALQEHGQGLASQEYNNAFQRQAGLASGADQASMWGAGQQNQAMMQAQQNQYGLAQTGYGAMGQLGQLGAGMYGQMGQNYMGAGQAQANVYGQMGQQLGQNYWQQQQANQQLAMAQAGLEGSTVNLVGGGDAAWANAAGQVAGGNFAIAGGSAGAAGSAMAGGGGVETTDYSGTGITPGQYLAGG